MRRLIKTLLWAALLALPFTAGFAIPSMAGGPALHLLSSCEEMDKGYLQLVSLSGEALPGGTGYLAYKDLGDGTAAVYRQTPPEVAALVAEIKAAEAAESGDAQLDESFWLAAKNRPCQYVEAQKECEGKCPKPGFECVLKDQWSNQAGQPGQSTRTDDDPGTPPMEVKDKRCLCVKTS